MLITTTGQNSLKRCNSPILRAARWRLPDYRQHRNRKRENTELCVPFYRSLCAGKVLLVARRSTLSVLAPQREAVIGFR
jgi:hypothetical protein